MAQTKKKKSPSTAKRTKNAKGKKASVSATAANPELIAVITVVLSVLLGFCIYVPGLCGTVGYTLKNILISAFGIFAAIIPLITAALGIYLWNRKDLKKLAVKSVFSFLALIFACGLLYTFGLEKAESPVPVFPSRFLKGGCGYAGIFAAESLSHSLGKIITAVLFLAVIICLCSLIFKVSFIKLISGFFESTKNEAAEIKREQSYEAGKKIRKTVDDVAASKLVALKQRSIDFDVDDIEESKKKKKKKAEKEKHEEKTSEDEDLFIKNAPKDIGVSEIDVPFPLDSEDSGELSDSELETIDDVLSRVDFETGEIVEEDNSHNEISKAEDNEWADAPPAETDGDSEKTKREKPLTEQQATALREQMDASVAQEPIPYKYPDVSLLSYAAAKKNSDTREELRDTANKLVSTLKSFGVEVKLSQVSRGPTVTRFELQPSVGVKVSKITNLSDDIALNLAATAVRIEAPIPGKAAIGIEIPNKEVSSVSLREVIETEEFKNAPSKLSVAMGMDITGKPAIADIAKMPHVLIAGATGSGKSVCINSIITSILYKADPNEVKLIMVDPKKVELDVYNGIPHLLIPVVTEPKKASGALGWAVSEMMRRYDLFAENGVRNLQGYNEVLKLAGEPELPQIVIIVDELSDLMMVAPKEIEDSICRLAQMARAAGMHLIIATQRPSVNVITGVIKANIPSRIAFAVSSQIDSRTILDGAGAEKLLGKGDMLFMPMGASKATRLQGAFISDKEVEAVVEFVKGNSEVRYDDDISEKINSETEVEPDMSDCDELLPKAIEIAIASGSISTSMVQRRLGVGYARAGRIIDQMEERGIISGADGSKPRNVLVSADELKY